MFDLAITYVHVDKQSRILTSSSGFLLQDIIEVIDSFSLMNDIEGSYVQRLSVSIYPDRPSSPAPARENK